LCRWAGHECFVSVAGRVVYTLYLCHLRHPLKSSGDTDEKKEKTTHPVI